MKQEEKDLLFKELCARIPYGVKVQCEDYLFTFDKNHMGIGMLYEDFNRNPLESPKIILSGCYYGEDIKPYLFPLSSMTEGQAKELFNLFGIDLLDSEEEDYIKINEITGITFFLLHGFDVETHLDKLINWLNKNHFDYRGLIEKGLAIDCTNLNIY